MSDVQPPAKPSVWRVLKDQRKIELVALGLMVASFWLAGAAGEWRLAFCIAVGVLLGLVNHLATEYWLLKTISSGAQPTRSQMVASTIVSPGRHRRRRHRRGGDLLARRHRPAARPRHLPAHRPRDDHDPAAQGVEEAMTGLLTLTGLVPFAAEGGEDEPAIEIGHHVTREFLGMTFNIDTIISTLVAGVLVLLLGFWATRSLTKDTDGPRPHQGADPVGDRRRRGEQAGQGQPRQGAPVRGAAGDLAVLLHPVRQLARAGADRAQRATRTCCRRRPPTPT